MEQWIVAINRKKLQPPSSDSTTPPPPSVTNKANTINPTLKGRVLPALPIAILDKRISVTSADEEFPEYAPIDDPEPEPYVEMKRPNNNTLTIVPPLPRRNPSEDIRRRDTPSPSRRPVPEIPTKDEPPPPRHDDEPGDEYDIPDLNQADDVTTTSKSSFSSNDPGDIYDDPQFLPYQNGKEHHNDIDTKKEEPAAAADIEEGKDEEEIYDDLANVSPQNTSNKKEETVVARKTKPPIKDKPFSFRNNNQDDLQLRDDSANVKQLIHIFNPVKI